MGSSSVNYDDVLKRRLQAIQAQGDSATVNADNAAQIQGLQDNINRQTQFNQSLQQASRSAYTPTGGKDFNKFMNAITGQESNGNYKAVNPDSGALGRYQVMPDNVASWSKEALGHSVTPQQFLASQQIQNSVAQYKLKQYYDMYGAAGAAVAWYAGPGKVSGYLAANGSGYGKKQGAYPSIQEYVNQILRRMGY